MTCAVKLYTSPRGDSPVKDFLDNLDKATRAKSVRIIELLQNHGSALPPPYSKKLRPGLYELRISGQITIRILYSFYRGEYYLLHAFKKKSQKTPQKELRIALDRKDKLI